MKRTLNEYRAGSGKATRRQNPVSCQLCRSKKLRCDRLTPCSNCASRQIPCIPAFEGTPKPDNQGEIQAQRPPWTSNTISHHSCSSCSQEPDLAMRVRRLEDAVFPGSEQQRLRPNMFQRQEHPDYEQAQIQAAENTQRTTSDTVLNMHEPDLAIGMNGYLLLSTTPPHYKQLSVAEIAGILPSPSVARTLFSFYVEKINWAQHIIHVPTTYDRLEALYDKIAKSARPESPFLSLIAAIFAVAAYFWPETSIRGPHAEESKACCRRWILLVQRALMESNHLASPTIETLQAKMTLTHFLPTFPQTTGRMGHQSLLVNEAHILQLHRVDSLYTQRLRANNDCDVIELEIKRRVWWNLVAIDWMLSFMCGAQLGTYITHPDHMNVHYPSNANDENITHNNSKDQPFLGPPTEMSFTIAKIRVSTIIRELTDAANKAQVGVEELEYGQILAFDRKMNDFYDSLPSYFKYDETSRPHVEALYLKQPYLERQRSFIYFGIHHRLALLHRPFLARAYKDPHYRYSRAACLRSTRIVIEMQEPMRLALSGRMWLVMYHVFIATTTLVMDYFCQKDDPEAAAEMKKEILKCYRILEQSEGQDPEVKLGLANLKQITNDWRLRSDPASLALQSRLSNPGFPSVVVGEKATSPSSEESHDQPQPRQHNNLAQLPHHSNDAITTEAAPSEINPIPAPGPALSWPSNINQVDNISSGSFSADRQSWSTDIGYLATIESSPNNGGIEWPGPRVDPPDLWFYPLNVNADSVNDLQWELLFRDLESQQFVARF